MNKGEIKIIEKYLPYGVIKGGDFLLTPEIMILFIDDLSELPVIITGCDLWRFLDPEKKPGRIVQLLGAGLSIGDNVIDPRKNSKEGIAEILKEYINSYDKSFN
jgi:hypothetical protein